MALTMETGLNESQSQINENWPQLALSRLEASLLFLWWLLETRCNVLSRRGVSSSFTGLARRWQRGLQHASDTNSKGMWEMCL